MLPYLDSPQTIDHEVLPPQTRSLLANQELRFFADNASDLFELFWPWANAAYAASIRLRIFSLIGDELTPITNRYYPGYQETILGNESIIVSKRLMAPYKSSEDRSVIWNLECQAEGDHVLRLEVEIDWGEPLTQRMVDGLLVAQHNPQAPRGMYEQSNADSTRVFGNPQARPDRVEIDDPQQARLVYHVLVNGEVQVPLLLTISDVGEQMAWSTFLGLRESDETFDKSVRNWEETLRTGRLWTPNASVNQAVQNGRVLALRHLQQLRTGYTSPDRSTLNAAKLIAALDVFDPTVSRNVLAHFRRIVEQSNGKVPTHFPLHPKAAIADPDLALIQTNSIYLQTLHEHLQRHFDADLLTRHFTAVQLCCEALIRNRWERGNAFSGAELWQSENALRIGLLLATLQRDGVNAIRWESEACEFKRVAEEQGTTPVNQSTVAWNEQWATCGWQPTETSPWTFAEPWRGIELAGAAVWQGLGIDLQRRPFAIRPTFSADWHWWALLDLPTAQGKLRLVWDGVTLYSTLPIQSALPVQLHPRIRALGFDELDWNPRFEFVDDGDVIQSFYPKFLTTKSPHPSSPAGGDCHRVDFD